MAARIDASPGGSQETLMSSLQLAFQSWLGFDWDSRLSQLEKTAIQAKEQKEHSLTARKQLGETTKQFKKSVKSMEQASAGLAENLSSSDHSTVAVKTMDGLAKECRKTVKAYQEEIDNLTRRCKSSETACSSIHHSLLDVPEPANILRAAMERIDSQQAQLTQLFGTLEGVNREMQSIESNAAQQASRYEDELAQLASRHEDDMAQLRASKMEESASGALSKAEHEELIQLRGEVAEYEVEFRSLKNQDITIRKLEGKISELQRDGETAMKQQLEKAQQDLAETEGRRASEALEREAVMERRVQTLELQLKAERAGREATQVHLLEADEGAGEREAAWEAQRRILIDDSERLRETLHEATRERDELRLRVAALEGDGSARTGPTPPPSGSLAMSDLLLERKAYEAEVSELSHTANALREELRIKEDTHSEERRAFHSTIDSLEQERNALSSSVMTLESQLAAAPSHAFVDNMKRELRILKRLEYNADDVDAERDPEMTGVAEDEEEKDFESVLVAKLRRVESELVRERNQKMDHAKECDELRRELSTAQKAREDSETLVASLEVDLEKAIAAPASQKATSPLKTPVPVDGESPATLQHILDPDAPTPPPSSKAMPNTSVSAAEKADDDHSVATIVMAQRDRLRARNEALEAERDSFKRELQVQVQAAESLKSDNTKLYEKVRYLQNFNSSSGGASRAGAYNRSGSMSDRDLDLEALEQRYEASVDPFRQFSRTERQRKMSEMSPMERIVFIVARTVLGSKEMRTALFFYVCAMHLLVFITTYHWSHSCDVVDPEHLTHLPPVLNNGELAKSAAEAVASTVVDTGG